MSSGTIPCSNGACKGKAYGGGKCWPCLSRALKAAGWRRCNECSEPAVECDPFLGGDMEFCPKHVPTYESGDEE